ncbi:hypothetical protein HCN44_003735 [Aphidius gifuensis]|uniref:Ig-like domain-containing protein n=1 Tax=Aphidius gifuensis TaxID=684658 RepID=A0A835CL41_APHGI|nr:hypothetical protein HCN44_003735 [Aphidius gifuensis]
MEMLADTTRRGSVLEPEGIVEIKFRKKNIIKTIHRVYNEIIKLNEKITAALQLEYPGVINGKDAEIMENDVIQFSCSSDEIDFDNIKLIYPVENRPNGIFFHNEPPNNDKKKIYKKINASHSDSGWYGCSDKEGNTNKIFISVKSINHESSTNIVERISENVFHPQRILSCKPTSQIYSVQLFVNSEEVRFNNSNGIKYDGQEGLKIRNQTYINDPMDYVCAITTENRTENTIYYFIREDTDEPKIHINDPVNVMEGDDIRINCTIRYDIDEDQKEFNWSFKNKKLQSRLSENNSIHKKKTIELNLLNVSNNDAGEYKCITRGVNSEKSASVHVTIHGVDALNISLTTPKEFYSSKLNNVVILKVNIESNARTNTTWFHPDGSKIIQLNSNGKYFIKNNDIYSSLIINNVQMNDAGNYSVKVKITSLKDVEKIISLPLVIEGIPVIKAMNTSQNYYMINDTAELSCYATGFPIPKFQWIVDGIRTRNYQTSKDNDSLLFEKTEKFIFNVTKMVDVTCKVCITQDDNSCEKKNLQIRMIDVPNGFGTTKYDETIISGDEFGVTCLASLYMYKEVNWYNENGTEVVSDNNIMIQKNTTELSHSSSLSIKSVPNSKRLLYTCKARKVEDNMVEQTNINVTVYDELAPYFIYTNMNKTTVTYDSNTAQLIMLKCYAGGYPVPSVTWLINQKKINSTFYRDVNVPRRFKKNLSIYGDDGTSEKLTKKNHIYMDSIGFGFSCCCHQQTMQAYDIKEAKIIYMSN